MLTLIRTASALMLLAGSAPALAQEKSQQNAADPAVKGDLAKAKDSGDRAAINEAEKQLEWRAEEAKRKTDEKVRAETMERMAESVPELAD